MGRSKRMFAAVLVFCLTLVMGFASVSVSAATKPTKLYLSATASTVDIGGKVTVKVSKAKPSKASKSVTWKSSNKQIATVSSKGVVTGKKKGTVKITATSKSNKKVKATKKITVKDLKATSVKLDRTSAEIYETGSVALKATVKGSAGFYNQGVTWKSSDTKVATVSKSGSVTGVSAGTATITATEKGGTKKASCTVTVKSLDSLPSSESFNYSDKQVYVDPLYVAALQHEGKKNVVIADVAWGSDYSTSSHIKDAIHINTDAVENDDCDPWPYGDGFDDASIYGRRYVSRDENMNIRDASQLKTFMRRNGITEDTEVILYNGNGHGPAAATARVALAMLYYGVDRVRIVDGGYPVWEKDGLPTETKTNEPNAGHIWNWSFGDGTYPEHPEYIKSIDEVQDKLVANPDDNFRLVSIRSRNEFEGKESGYGYIDYAGEPKGAVWGLNTDEGAYHNADGTVISYDKMKSQLLEYGTDVDKNETSFYCGTGWRASIPFLIAYQNGNTNVSVYDGGWLQWQNRWQLDSKTYPIQKVTPEEAASFESASFAKESVELEVGDTANANLKIKGAKKTVTPIYKSDNESVAKISEDGTITAVGVGAAKITASFDGDDRTITMGVNVKSPSGYNYVSAKDIFDNLKSGEFILLDARKTADYKAAHIPTAVSASVDASISADSTDGAAAVNVKAVVDKYGTDQKYIVICYSGNRYAKEATKQLQAAGVDNSNIFTLGGDNGEVSSNGGMKAWNAAYPNYVAKSYTSTGNFEFNDGITVDQLKADMSGSKLYTVIDLRSADDYAAGHISGAVSAPISTNDADDETSAATLKKVTDANPNGIFVVQCYSGNKYANKAVSLMRDTLNIPEGRIIVLEGGAKAASGNGMFITEPVVDKDSKTVTISATVNNTSDKTMHYVVNEKGSMASKAIMTTKVTNDQFEAAMSELSATPWDSEKKVTHNKGVGKAGDTAIKDLVKAGTGNAGFSKVEVSVKYKGTDGTATHTMAETLKNAPALDMIYANTANNQNDKFGCLTCLTSCYSGMVANQNVSWADSNWAAANTSNLPAKGETVLVTYTLK